MKKFFLLIFFTPIFTYSQTEFIYDLRIGDYNSVQFKIDSIEFKIDDIKQKMKESIISKSNSLNDQTYFETDEDYIDIIYKGIYSDLSGSNSIYHYNDQINSLLTKRTYYENFVFTSENIKLNLIDTNYNANTSEWTVNGHYNLLDFQNIKDTFKISDFELKVNKSDAKYLFKNKDHLIFSGIFSKKYGQIKLVSVVIYSSDASNTVIDHKFNDFDELNIKPWSSSYNRSNSYSRDSIVSTSSLVEDIELLELSNQNNFLAIASKRKLTLYSLDSNKFIDIILCDSVSVEKKIKNNYGDKIFNYTYYNTNINDWNIEQSFKEKNKKSEFVIEDIEFSPNDSLLIISISNSSLQYEFESSMTQKFESHKLICYDIYKNQFSEIVSTNNLLGPIYEYTSTLPFKNITFSFMDNNSVYVNITGILFNFKLNNSNEIKTFDIGFSFDNFKIGFDNSLLLINTLNDDYLYNLNTKKIYVNYTLPADYYNLFHNFQNPLEYQLLFDISSNKNYDIRCPKCSHNFLKLSNNNIFKCESYYCDNQLVIINDKFYDYTNINFSLCYKDLFVYKNSNSLVSLVFTTDQACKYGYLDKCGKCVGGVTGNHPCVKDCEGNYGGSAYLDKCNICVGGNTDILANKDLDSCGVCFGDNSSCKDCNGVINGYAFIDNCGICVGGNTNQEACVEDCYGTYGGSASLDECDRCVGGITDLKPCTIKYRNNKIKSIIHENINGDILFQETRYDNVFIKSQISFKKTNRYEKYFDRNGNLSGIIRYYHSNGQLKSEIDYSSGKIKVKKHYKYHNNGVVSHKINMYSRHGVIKEFDKNGRRIERYKCDRYGNRINE